jgi:transposase
MLKQILAHQLFDGKGWKILSMTWDRDRGVARVFLMWTRFWVTCSKCGAARSEPHDVKKTRTWRHLDCWGVRTYISAPVRRVKCPRCGIRVERVPWARTGARMTHQFESEILRRALDSSIQAVCRQLGVHWTTVMGLLKRWVRDSAAERFQRPLRRIGVDEVSYGRGQRKFLTIVWDHDAGRVVWIDKGKGRAPLVRFFRALGKKRRAQLVCVTMDMSQAYISAVRKYASHADIVFDKFHIEQHLGRAVNAVRKHEFRRADATGQALIRGKKFLLLARRIRLHWRKRRIVDQLLAANQPLSEAYQLREQFATVWASTTEMEMGVRLGIWLVMLQETKLKPLFDFWAMIGRHMLGVLAWAKHRLTNAALESNNARVRTISHRGHGYRNATNLMTVLYHAMSR